MIERTFKAKALVFAVFALGIGAGVLASNVYTTRLVSAPAPAPNAPDRSQAAQRDINKFYDYLGATPDQREQMHKIAEDTRHEFQDLAKETQPRMETIREASRAKIRAVLNDDQRKKYDEFRKKMEERRRNRDLKKNSGNNKTRDLNSDHGSYSN